MWLCWGGETRVWVLDPKVMCHSGWGELLAGITKAFFTALTFSHLFPAVNDGTWFNVVHCEFFPYFLKLVAFYDITAFPSPHIRHFGSKFHHFQERPFAWLRRSWHGAATNANSGKDFINLYTTSERASCVWHLWVCSEAAANKPCDMGYKFLIFRTFPGPGRCGPNIGSLGRWVVLLESLLSHRNVRRLAGWLRFEEAAAVGGFDAIVIILLRILVMKGWGLVFRGRRIHNVKSFLILVFST